MSCLLRRAFDPTTLFARTPPRWRDRNKQLVFDLACPADAVHGATPIEITQWSARAVPTTIATTPPTIAVVPDFFDYASTTAASWHVNFADPELFGYYRGSLLAQDELQVIEHPVLGALREAFEVAELSMTTVPTPILVRGAERRCALDTAPCASRPGGLYGNRFAGASADDIRAAVRVLVPPTITNLIAIAAPRGRGRYTRAQFDDVLVTALTGFAAAVDESRACWPGAPVEICTGFWGCGAFGGDRHVMTVLQVLAARAAGVDRVRFYVGDAAGRATYDDAADLLATIGGTAEVVDVARVLAALDARAFAWGSSDGN